MNAIDVPQQEHRAGWFLWLVAAIVVALYVVAFALLPPSTRTLQVFVGGKSAAGIVVTEPNRGATYTTDARGKVRLPARTGTTELYFITLPNGVMSAPTIRGSGDYEIYFADEGTVVVRKGGWGPFRSRSVSVSAQASDDLLEQRDDGKISEDEFTATLRDTAERLKQSIDQ